MTAPLDHVYARIDRAQHHLNVIDQMITAYLAQPPYSLIIQNETLIHTVAEQLRAEGLGPADFEGIEQLSPQVLAGDVQQLPIDLPLAVGDCLHSLRAALDNLAFEVVRQHKVNPPADWERWTAFPIRDKPSPKPLLGVTIPLGPITKALESLQPYFSASPTSDLLRKLRDLNDWDKHRTLRLTVAYGGRTQLTVTFPDGTVETSHPYVIHQARTDGAGQLAWHHQTLEQGEHLGSLDLREVLPPLIRQPGALRVKSDIQLNVSLDDSSTRNQPAQPVSALLQSMISLVRNDIVTMLDPLI